MTYKRTVLLSLVVGAILGPAIYLGLAQGPPNQTATYFTPNRVREDFTATVDNQTFQCTGAGVGSYLEVYRNGLLQRAGAGADYTAVSVGGAQKVTFNVTPLGPVPMVGDYVTLFYYR